MSSSVQHHKDQQQQSAATTNASPEAQPLLNQRGRIVQQPDTVRRLPLGLSDEVRLENIKALNQVLANTIMIHSLYKKSHWQVSGPTFYQLHLLFDKHATEQDALIDLVGERVQLLGGIALGMPQDVVHTTTIEAAPGGAEEVPVIIDRLLEAHERILTEVRAMAERTEKNGDLGTNDLLVSNVLRTNELQVWFLAEHVVDVPTVKAHDGAPRGSKA